MKYLPVLGVVLVVLIISFILIGKVYIIKSDSYNTDNAKSSSENISDEKLVNTLDFVEHDGIYELKGVVKSINHISRKITLIFNGNISKQITYNKDTKVVDVQLLEDNKFESSDSTINEIKVGDMLMVLCEDVSCESTKSVSIINDQTK